MRMSLRAWVCAVLLAFAVSPARARDVSTLHLLMDDAPAVSTAADRTFVAHAVRNHGIELLISQIAVRRADGQAVRDYARHMLVTHGKAGRLLLKTTREARIPRPGGPTIEQQRAITELYALEGRNFDRRYMELQLALHSEAIEIYRDLTSNGDSFALKRMAEEILPTLKQHLHLAERIAPPLGALSGSR